MDTLKNKKYEAYTYLSRYTPVPYYFDTIKKREVYGIGTNLIKTANDYFYYTVKTGDNLDSIALTYYNNPTFWWVLAYFNDIYDAFEDLIPGRVLKIPTITGIAFGADR